MTTVVDVPRLVAVLEARTRQEPLSWRQAAGQIGVSPALLSRLRNGLPPDLTAYTKIVDWLKMPADEFLRRPSGAAQGGEPELMSEVSALLRARSDLGESDKQLLENIFRSALDHLRATHSGDD